MDNFINQHAFPDSDAKPNKRRKKKSMVWDHFTVEKINPDCVRACCNQCKKSFAYISGSKLAGTSHLKRHIALGICPVSRHNQEKGQLSSHAPAPRTNSSANGTKSPRKRYRAANGIANIYIDGNSWGNELAKMIIQHDYPLHMVEHTGFIEFTRGLQPQFNVSSVSTVEEQIMGIYTEDKHKLMDLLSAIPGRLSLTVDLWTSSQSLTYALLTGHFTDHQWKLQRRILNFVIVQFPDSDSAFNDAVAACLTDWNAEDKLFTISLDRSYANENARKNLRNLPSVSNSLTRQLLVDSCYARMLRSLAQDAIKSMRESIEKVRLSVKYVKISEAREDRFIKLKQQLQVPSTKNLMIDDLTKWNTTYQMLMAACELKEVFSCLDTVDPDYKSTLSLEEWGQVGTLCTYLKTFFEAANILTSPTYPTTNSFFAEVWKIHLALSQAAASQDFFVSTLTKPLQEKFTKYWEDCNLVLAIAAVMDPRFKMKYVEFYFARIYGEKEAKTWVNIVNDSLHELYLHYVMQSHLGPTFLGEGDEHLVKAEVSNEDVLLHSEDGLIDFDIDITDIMGEPDPDPEHEHEPEPHRKLEIDQYIEESHYPRVQDFDVLGWWKSNRLKYPTLSKMASDVLSIPLSTLPPESVFDTRDNKVDNYKSSLRPATLQALFCAKDWLRHASTVVPPLGISSEIIPAATVKSEF